MLRRACVIAGLILAWGDLFADCVFASITTRDPGRQWRYLCLGTVIVCRGIGRMIASKN
jgi:hypothetical protein